MDKSELASYLENLKLAASKCSSFSVHLNELKKSVFAVGRPVAPEVSTNYNNEDDKNDSQISNELQQKPLNQGADESGSHEDLISTEEKEVPNLISSVSESVMSDVFSNSLAESAEQDGEFVSEREYSLKNIMSEGRIQDGEYVSEKEDSLKNIMSADRMQDSVLEIKEYEKKDGESDKQCLGNMKNEEGCFIKANDTDSSIDLTSSDEDDNQVYSELLKQIEIEETNSRQMKDSPEIKSYQGGNNTESITSDSQSEDLEDVSDIYLQNYNKPKYQAPLLKRTKEIMESIEENNEDLEDINDNITSGHDEISSEKLLYIQSGNNYSNKHKITTNCKLMDIHPENDEKCDDLNVKVKRADSKLSTNKCRRSNSQKTLVSRKVSQDNINSGVSDIMSMKSKSGKSNYKKKGARNDKNDVKKVPSLSKYASKHLKSGPNSKLKLTNNVQNKPMVSKITKNSKTKTNVISKVVPKNLNKINLKQDISQPINHSKNRYSKSIYTMKKNLISQDSGKEMKVQNEQIPKNIEPLIKTNPTNIFLRNELDKICVQENRGAGDGIKDKVRSKAIIDSMNHTINEKANKTFVPSHFIKSNTIKKEVQQLYSPHAPIRLKQTNQIENHSISNKSSIKKPENQSALNKNFKNNSKLDSYKSDIALSQVEHKNIKLRRESTAVDPKDILAQLEKEIILKKSDENLDEENELTVGIKPSKILDHVNNKNLKRNEILNIKNQRVDKKTQDNLKESQNTKITCSLDVIRKSSKNKSTKKEHTKESCSKIKTMNELSNVPSSNIFQLCKKNGNVKNENMLDDSISRITSKMVNLNFDGTKSKLNSFPFILGQSTNKSYNIQANLQQALSIMMMLPSDAVKQTLSVETKISSRCSTRTADTVQSRQARCPACVLKTDTEDSNNNLIEDPWDTEYAHKNFIRCTCLPRNTVSFNTVIKQLLAETSMGSLLPISETNTVYEESIDRNYDKQMGRRPDLTHLTKLLHVTQRIRDRLAT